MEIPTQEIVFENNHSVKIFIRREDLLHPHISGNKFRKLKYNLLEAQNENAKTLLTFGGAFSNHIAALAYAGKKNNFNTIGVIRGEELENNFEKNPTLRFAQECDMQFYFITREHYREKNSIEFINHLKEKFNNFYLVPEGGTNEFAIKGCEEILTSQDSEYDYIACAVGTGGTISGIINSSFEHQKILGFPALKGDFLQKDIAKFAKNNNWQLFHDYHFGGYAKINSDLIRFINKFQEENKIPLDPIYTGKMVFGINDLVAKNYFPENSKILVIHTGGLQGVKGMNNYLKNKGLPLIDTNV